MTQSHVSTIKTINQLKRGSAHSNCKNTQTNKEIHAQLKKHNIKNHLTQQAALYLGLINFKPHTYHEINQYYNKQKIKTSTNEINKNIKLFLIIIRTIYDHQAKTNYTKRTNQTNNPKNNNTQKTTLNKITKETIKRIKFLEPEIRTPTQTLKQTITEIQNNLDQLIISDQTGKLADKLTTEEYFYYSNYYALPITFKTDNILFKRHAKYELIKTVNQKHNLTYDITEIKKTITTNYYSNNPKVIKVNYLIITEIINKLHRNNI